MPEFQPLRDEVSVAPVWAVAWGPWAWPQLGACSPALVWPQAACSRAAVWLQQAEAQAWRLPVARELKVASGVRRAVRELPP